MRSISFVFASAVALAACSGGPARPVGSSTAGKSALAVAPLEFGHRKLANGLEVYSMPDPDTANVSVQVWYRVGSKDDPVGRSGFAHLFEHIMFKATRNMPAETFDRLTEDVGGFNNASTWDDFTNYYAVVPANHLRRVLWAEADRMGTLVVDKATFASERDVVKEELRQSVLAQPYGRLLYLYFNQTGYARHPYGRPGIGSIEDLDAATVDDVRAFHATYYRPDNAVLIVSGRFDQASLDRWVDEYFAPIARPARPIPRVTAVEPPRVARDYTVREPNVPLPAVLFTYPSFPAHHADRAALMVLDAILAKGKSSRLYRSLVYDKEVASDVLTMLEPTQQASLYGIGAILSEGKTADQGAAALQTEIARLRDAAVTQAELDEASSEIVTETIAKRETAFGRAYELGDSIIRFGDARESDELVAAVQRVTAADVQRVARTWLRDDRRVTIRYLSESAGAGRDDRIASAPTIEAQRLTIPQAEIPVYALAPEAQRRRPPEPEAPVAARLPQPAERRLANGLRVIVSSKRDLPLVSADLRILSGGSSDPAGRAGLAQMAAELVVRGTKTRGATEIAREIESLGATLSTDADADGSAVSLLTRADRAGQGFAVLADVVQHPLFDARELERERRQALDGLTVSLRQPGDIAGMAMTRAIYGGAPYGAVASPQSLAAIRREEVASFHGTHWRPDNSVLVIAGDLTPEEGFALADRHFGGWPRGAGTPPPEPDAAGAAAESRAIVVNLPKSGQAAVSFGLRGVARADQDYFPALVASTVLGGGYSARLNLEIRIRRGLSYGAGCSLAARMAPGPLVAFAQTRNDAAAEVVKLMEIELERLRKEPVGPAELTARKAALIGDFGRDVETVAGLTGQLAQVALFGIPLDRLQRYVADVEAVTPDQVRAAADRLFDPKHTDLIVVGDANAFYDAIRRARPQAERIGIDQLNLDSPSLR